MIENRNGGRTGDKELSGKIDWIVVSNSFLPELIKLYTHALGHCKPSLLTSSPEIGFGDMNFLDNGLRAEVTCASFRLEYFCLPLEILSSLMRGELPVPTIKIHEINQG